MNSFDQHQLTLSLVLPSEVNTDRLAQWLCESGFRYPFQDALKLTDDSVSYAGQMSFVKAWLMFHQHLLIDSGVPVFKASEISQMKEQEKGRYQLTLNLFAFAEFRDLVVNTLSKSLSWVAKMHATPYAFEAYQALGQQLEKELYRPVKKISNSGLSNIPLLRYAYENDIPMQYLGAGLYQLGWGANSHWLYKSSTEQDSVIGSTLSGYKHFSASYLQQMGLPAPQNAIVSSFEKARIFAERIGYPVVIKPEKGNRGEGVVKDIDNLTTLKQAFEQAKTFNELIVVEKQAPGVCYRFFVYKNDVIYVNGNLPRRLLGNGKSTITELIAADHQQQLNLRPWQRDPELHVDEELEFCLNAQGLNLESVPDNNQSVTVRKIGSMHWGTEDAPAISEVHEDNIRLAVDSAKAMHLATAGVDIILEDVACSWTEQSCIINEINSSPMIGASQASLEGLPKLIELMLPNQGRIPIAVFVGGADALKSAKDYQLTKCRDGISAYLTSHQLTLDSSQRTKPMTFHSLSKRVTALLQSQPVELLAVVVQTDEILTEKWPVDRIDYLEVMDDFCESDEVLNSAVTDFLKAQLVVVE